MHLRQTFQRLPAGVWPVSCCAEAPVTLQVTPSSWSRLSRPSKSLRPLLQTCLLGCAHLLSGTLPPIPSPLLPGNLRRGRPEATPAFPTCLGKSHSWGGQFQLQTAGLSPVVLQWPPPPTLLLSLPPLRACGLDCLPLRLQAPENTVPGFGCCILSPSHGCLAHY